VDDIISVGSRLTELAIEHSVLDILKDLELDLKFCAGVGIAECKVISYMLHTYPVCKCFKWLLLRVHVRAVQY
jgi:hypothetical protein